MLWQVLLLWDLRINVSRGEPLVLVLCVWCVYLGDRVLDAVRTPTVGWEPIRKTFYRNYRQLAAIIVSGLLLSALPLAYRLLRRPTFLAGLALVVPLIFYLAFVHLAPTRWRTHWPREMAVACVFTCGVFLAAWIGDGKSFYRLWGPAVLLGLLCWVNCCAIETWEWQKNMRRVDEQPSNSARWATRHLLFLALGIAGLTALMRHMTLVSFHFSLAAFFSGVALAALAIWRSYLPMNSLRVAADVALCTPLPIFFLHLLS